MFLNFPTWEFRPDIVRNIQRGRSDQYHWDQSAAVIVGKQYPLSVQWDHTVVVMQTNLSPASAFLLLL